MKTKNLIAAAVIGLGALYLFGKKKPQTIKNGATAAISEALASGNIDAQTAAQLLNDAHKLETLAPAGSEEAADDIKAGLNIINTLWPEQQQQYSFLIDARREGESLSATWERQRQELKKGVHNFAIANGGINDISKDTRERWEAMKASGTSTAERVKPDLNSFGNYSSLVGSAHAFVSAWIDKTDKTDANKTSPKRDLIKAASAAKKSIYLAAKDNWINQGRTDEGWKNYSIIMAESEAQYKMTTAEIDKIFAKINL